MTERRALLCAGAGLLVLLLGWLAWGRGSDGADLLLLGALAISSFLFAAAVSSSQGVRGAAYAVVAAAAFLAAAVDSGTGYDQRNVFCLLLGTVFAVTAAVRAQQGGQRLHDQETAARGERAVAAVAWTSSLLLIAAVLTFVLVTVVALWLAGG